MQFSIWVSEKYVEGCIHPRVYMCIQYALTLHVILLFFSSDISSVCPSIMSDLVVYNILLWCMYVCSCLCFRSSMVSLSSTATCCSHTEGLSATAAMVRYIHYGHLTCVCDSFVILSHLYPFKCHSQQIFLQSIVKVTSLLVSLTRSDLYTYFSHTPYACNKDLNAKEKA